MRYRYRSEDELKDSGVEWIGKVPKDWKVSKLKNLVTIVTGNTPSKNDEDNYKDGYIPWIKPDNITDEFKVTDSKEKLSYEGAKQARLIPKNSALVCCIGTVGKVGINEVECATNQQINSIIFDKEIWENKFGIYTLIASRQEHERNSSKVVVSILNKSQQGNIYMPITNINEQEKIANFLDEKTSQFDLIISKKEKLIERLEEAKKSLISEVVTGKVKVVKTDDGYELIKRSSEEMKDSGVEWLGSIPKDWEVKKLKYIATINPPKSSVKKFVDKDIDVSFVPMDSVRLGNIKLDKTKKISEVIDGYTLFEDNDIVMAKVTPCFENRNIAICKGLTNKIGFGSSELNTIRVYENKDIKFMFYHLQEQKFMDTATYQMTGAGGLKRVPTSFLLNAQFTYPSDNEKERIVFYLENYIDKIDNISEKTKEQIEKLKEAKQSLISEAVTGKIEILD